jgi:hypothetical protein
MSNYNDNFWKDRVLPLLIVGGIIVIIALIIEGVKKAFSYDTLSIQSLNPATPDKCVVGVWCDAYCHKKQRLQAYTLPD